MGLKEKISGFLHRKGTTAYYWNLRDKAKNAKGYLLRRHYFMQHQKLMDRNGANIALEADIAKPPVFPHGLAGIFVSSGAKIGQNCVIFQQVTIGSNTLPDSARRGSPTLGDNVYIGCGAKIIGNVRVGNNVRIGANCVVTQNIPDNATVVLERPRILIREKPQDNRLVRYDEMVQSTEN